MVLNNIIYPTISYALTTGPHQPEYTSYEEPGASDMVNMLTGDFTFNLPILSVPIGDDGAFSVPLSYHAGIEPEQEASWVGLGWNVNVGSITRGINGFPDDANKESQTVTVLDPTGVRGWSASFLNFQGGWNSQDGHYGAINLGTLGRTGANIGYDRSGISSFGMAGLNISGGNVSFSAEQFALTVVQIGLTIATPLEGTVLDIAMMVGTPLVLDALMPNATPEVGTSGYWAYTRQTKKHLFYTDYWISLDQTRIEDMYGVLNLDKAAQGPNVDPDNFLKISGKINGNSIPTMNKFLPSTTTLNQGAASDITTDLSTPNYWENTSPALLAYDNFTVHGPGISGGIKPYRLEVGSVSVPREMSSNHVRLNPVPYMDYDSAKVPFVYEAAMGNNYFNHVGKSSGSITSPTLNFGINSSMITSSSGSPGPNTNYLQYDLNDVIFDNQRIRSDAKKSRTLPQGHFIDWLTNKQTNISEAYTNSAYMDYYKPADRNSVRSQFGFGGGKTYNTSQINNRVMTFSESTSMIAVNDVVDITTTAYDYTANILNPTITVYNTSDAVNAVGTNSVTFQNFVGYPSDMYHNYSYQVVTRNPTLIPDKVIGGFVITDPSGMNYHFSIPVYDYNFHTETSKLSEPSKRNMATRHAPFANTWLLTAITGPDFVDRGGVNNNGDGYIDENDWGYWVKFNYYKAGANFQWSLPYNKQKATSDNLYNAFASGVKEKYFLNSIETRSHVALFIQGTRQDGRDAATTNPQGVPRLSEINLITKDTYKTLLTKYKMPDASGARTVSYNASNFSSYLYNFLRASAIRRIVFNQDNSLCNGAPTSTSGKLTLKSMSICGRYDSTASDPNKVFPDYKFEYANNPSYDANKWDGWGMYSSQATASGLTHKPSNVDADGSAWSLTKVTNPEGSEILVTYERDTYTTISGTPFPSSDNTVISGSTVATLAPTYDYPTISTFNIADASRFKVGDKINISGTISYTCPNDGYSQSPPFSKQITIASITGSFITTTQPYATISCYQQNNVGVSISGSASPVAKRGGDIRVSSLTLNDPSGTSYGTRYQYDNGTVAIEPDYIKTSDLDCYKYLNYPATPVLYGQVTVFTGKLTTPSDYNTKQVYNFITPNTSQYSVNSNSNMVKSKSLMSSYQSGGLTINRFNDFSSLIEHQISRHTNQIGKITSQAAFDNNGVQFSKSDYVYTESPLNDGAYNYQGVFSEGTLLFEAVLFDEHNRYSRGQRTTSLTYPFALQKVVTTTDGFTTSSENKNWDKMTGAVLESRSTSPLGVITQSITVPAYSQSQYAEFDSKAKNSTNRNMLTQTAANYTYRLDNLGNQTGLLSASATTWKKDWPNYRILDGSNNYINSLDSSVPQIWRTNQSFAWKGSYSRLLPDGTQSFSGSDLFNFASGANPNWQLIGSHERYNHYSNLLEVKSMNGIYSSSKRGYLDQHTIASASNAKYEEIAYSGAEDQVVSNYFGGEVSLGSGTVVSTAHSGGKALSLSSGYGFVFKTTGLSANKMYRASAWTNSIDGRLYYKLNGQSEVSSTAPGTATKSGNWYRIDLMITASSPFSSLEVGVKSATGASVIFDDFRFQPAQSAMTSYVYDPVTRNLTYILDNDNLYTRYEYNARGMVIKTYSESFRYNGERLVLENKDSYKRNYTNP